MNKQEFYRQKYQKLKPSWKDSLMFYKEIIDQNVHQNTRILDIGCGHADFLETIYIKTPNTYGIDPDKNAIEKNTIIRNKVVGFADNLPFKDNFFDLVVSAWVLEHLKNPKKAFKEIYRILKPGGKVIFLTPNVWNYNVWMIRIVPDRFHDFFTRKLYDRQENDTYPKQYKINSIKKIDKTLLPIGFKKFQLILNSDPSYISFNKPFFKFACLLEKLMDAKFLNFAKVHLIGVYQK